MKRLTHAPQICSLGEKMQILSLHCFFFFVSLALSQKVGQDLSCILSPLYRPAHSKQLPSKAIRFRESGRCDGKPIKGGFVCRRLHFVTSGRPSALARAQTGVKGAVLLPWRTPVEIGFPVTQRNVARYPKSIFSYNTFRFYFLVFSQSQTFETFNNFW